MEHFTASTSAIPFSGEDWFDPLEDAIRFRVRADELRIHALRRNRDCNKHNPR